MAITYSEAQRHMESLGKTAQWRERTAYHEARGYKGGPAWRMGYKDVCQDIEAAQVEPEIAEEPAELPIAEPTEADFQGRTCTLPQAIEWVSKNVYNRPTFADTPDPVAWQLWRWANMNPTDFFNKHVLATMPKQSDLAAAAARDETGSGIIEALEAVERSIREAEQQ